MLCHLLQVHGSAWARSAEDTLCYKCQHDIQTRLSKNQQALAEWLLGEAQVWGDMPPQAWCIYAAGIENK